MENASKALLIAGGILIAMLVLLIGVNLFVNYSQTGSSYEQNMEAIEIQKFNSNFLKFEGRTNITIQEIVTLAKFAKQYKEQTQIHVPVIIPTNRDLTNCDYDEFISLIQDNSIEGEEIKYFQCVVNSNESGIVESIRFN